MQISVRRVLRGWKAAPAVAFGVMVATPPAFAIDWTGAASTDWFDAGNWVGGVPATNDIVEINTPNPMTIGAPGATASLVDLGSSGGGAVLTISNGGTLSDYNATLGYSVGTSTATVEGAGSSWSNANNFIVGNSRNGILTISNGGAVSDARGYIAVGYGSVGIVTVDGAGSVWSTSGQLSVGTNGDATLTVSNGGVVSAAGVGIAVNSASGTLNIGAAVGQAAVAAGTVSAATVAFGAGTGKIVFNHTDANYTFAPLISGAGALLVEAGTTILSATNSYTGATTIDGGTLSVNGSTASSSLTTVNAGGTLGGNGTVGNTLINGGTLAPGNSIGLLTVQGNLSFTAASSYMVEVSVANADRVNVTGTATLSGATVNASFAAGSYITKQYTIVNAAGGVSGSFGALVNTNLPASFSSSLSYDAKNAYLNLTLNYVPPTPPSPTPNAPVAPAFNPLNGNQNSVGTTLVNYFNRSGGIPLVFGALTPTGLSQVAGEAPTGGQQTSFNAMTMFMMMMSDPSAVGRGFAAPNAPGYADEALSYAGNRKPHDAFAMFGKAPPPAPAFATRWSVWASGFGGSQTTDGNATSGTSTSTSSIGGVAVGADVLLSPSTVAGFSLTGGATNFSVANSGSGHSDLFQAGAFVRHSVASAYVTAAVAYGWQDITTDRTVTAAGLDRLHAQFNANSYSARVEGGNRYVTSWLGGIALTPYAAAQVIAFDLPAYAESATSGAGTFALAYAGQTVTTARSELGLRSDKSFAVADAILTLRGRAAWAHDYNTDRSASATFQALPGASFTVSGAAPAGDAALTTASAEMAFISGVSLAATFEGEFSEVTRSYAGKGVARYAW